MIKSLFWTGFWITVGILTAVGIFAMIPEVAYWVVDKIRGFGKKTSEKVLSKVRESKKVAAA